MPFFTAEHFLRKKCLAGEEFCLRYLFRRDSRNLYNLNTKLSLETIRAGKKAIILHEYSRIYGNHADKVVK